MAQRAFFDGMAKLTARHVRGELRACTQKSRLVTWP